ncbi:unnamed protein product [Amoebophrya sp. A25]|nr:unnamed protein product [Amoebophrya sp. A25]|eukprot:GSA25T00009273001.1
MPGSSQKLILLPSSASTIIRAYPFTIDAFFHLSSHLFLWVPHAAVDAKKGNYNGNKAASTWEVGEDSSDLSDTERKPRLRGHAKLVRQWKAKRERRRLQKDTHQSRAWQTTAAPEKNSFLEFGHGAGQFATDEDAHPEASRPRSAPASFLSPNDERRSRFELAYKANEEQLKMESKQGASSGDGLRSGLREEANSPKGPRVEDHQRTAPRPGPGSAQPVTVSSGHGTASAPPLPAGGDHQIQLHSSSTSSSDGDAAPQQHPKDTTAGAGGAAPSTASDALEPPARPTDRLPPRPEAPAAVTPSGGGTNPGVGRRPPRASSSPARQESSSAAADGLGGSVVADADDGSGISGADADDGSVTSSGADADEESVTSGADADEESATSGADAAGQSGGKPVVTAADGDSEAAPKSSETASKSGSASSPSGAPDGSGALVPSAGGAPDGSGARVQQGGAEDGSTAQEPQEPDHGAADESGPQALSAEHGGADPVPLLSAAANEPAAAPVPGGGDAPTSSEGVEHHQVEGMSNGAFWGMIAAIVACVVAVGVGVFVWLWRLGLRHVTSFR